VGGIGCRKPVPRFLLSGVWKAEMELASFHGSPCDRDDKGGEKPHDKSLQVFDLVLPTRETVDRGEEDRR